MYTSSTLNSSQDGQQLSPPELGKGRGERPQGKGSVEDENVILSPARIGRPGICGIGGRSAGIGDCAFYLEPPRGARLTGRSIWAERASPPNRQS